MSLWTAVGKLLQNSGWDVLITAANVTTVRVAKSLLIASHLKRTRLTHEISLVAFSKLKMKAFLQTNQTIPVDK